jgi:hypothetical protein
VKIRLTPEEDAIGDPDDDDDDVDDTLPADLWFLRSFTVQLNYGARTSSSRVMPSRVAT